MMTPLVQVDKAIHFIASAIANSVDWKEIGLRANVPDDPDDYDVIDDAEALVTEAKARDDPVAKYITKLKLATNTITLSLR